MSRTVLLLASFAGFSGVALGAFGAHALKERLAPHLLAIYHTGVQYQLWHTAALAVVAVLLRNQETPVLRSAAWAFSAGIAVFSGSLYALALSGQTWWGAVTPLGGLAFLLGWLCLGLHAWRMSP